MKNFINENGPRLEKGWEALFCNEFFIHSRQNRSYRLIAKICASLKTGNTISS